MSWFYNLLGFVEGDPGEVKSKLELDSNKYTLRSTVTGVEYRIGEFSTPTLEEIRSATLAELTPAAKQQLEGKCTVENVFGDVAEHHRLDTNRLALFQVASQLNCLEFPDSRVTPECGITGYSEDRTQGPCCAIACGAGTVFRHYYATITDDNGNIVQSGQTFDNQIECLRDFEKLVGNAEHNYMKVLNGYTLAQDVGLENLNKKLEAYEIRQREDLKGKLRVGVQYDVQVTSSSWGTCMLDKPDQLVTQVFGSACSVSYSGNSQELWEPIARLILEASYEATLWAAVRSAIRHKGGEGSRKVFLTALGGGVFGNDMKWIEDAIQGAIDIVCKNNNLALQIYLVSYCPPVHPSFQALVDNATR